MPKLLSLRLSESYYLKAIVGLIQLIRVPNLILLVVTQYFTRIFLIGANTSWKHEILDINFFLLVLSTVIIASAGYIINDYYDIKIDTINKPDKVVIGRIFRRRVAMAAHTVLNVVGVGIGFYLSKYIFLINCLAAVWLWFYSNRLKRLPFFGNFSIAALTALSIFEVDIYFMRFNPHIYVFGIFALFISLIREIIKDMEDIKGDMRFGCKTLPIVLGIRKTKIIIYFFLALLIITITGYANYTHNSAMRYYCLLMSIPTVYFIYRIYFADTKREYHFLSMYCKLIMLSGAIIMIFL
ncbi:geranylgeranylglycerol-phosphate geranylgeranyltransferase [Chondrinema litorale]|uniref:geranylgeranylglycerol-phosphate geranylgeranyltransferase n=1 Tax=Chondrinema litorale TaxID=2994555 RepID=UPI0025427F9F|nr:geranylgeranylglycerol-phosphate geranylgeranyltransferase [Chondrinema litorale]UZR92305.1 geranylgeranylglycerol-phosphate geranylgeranyltransferase [Chondrinema litorale]